MSILGYDDPLSAVCLVLRVAIEHCHWTTSNSRQFSFIVIMLFHGLCCLAARTFLNYFIIHFGWYMATNRSNAVWALPVSALICSMTRLMPPFLSYFIAIGYIRDFRISKPKALPTPVCAVVCLFELPSNNISSLFMQYIVWCITPFTDVIINSNTYRKAVTSGIIRYNRAGDVHNKHINTVSTW